METLIAIATAQALPEKQAPARVLIIPAGQVNAKGADGRAPWLLDDPAGVIATTKRVMGAADLVIDYEHQTIHSGANGQPAPAAGWIKGLDADAAGIWANVEWTAKAKSMIEAGEYRYFSPVFGHTRDRRITSVRSLALTNDPAFEHLTALAKAKFATPPGEIELDLTALRAALGLGAKVSDVDVIAAATKATDGATAAAKALGIESQPHADGFDAAIAVALAKAKAPAAAAAADPDPAKYVPIGMFTELQTEVAALKSTGAEASAVTAVDKAVEAGKVTPSQKDWALTYAKSNAAGFAEFVSKSPVIVGGGSFVSAVPPGAGTGALSAEELAICKATGVSEADFKKARGDVDAKTEEAA